MKKLLGMIGLMIALFAISDIQAQTKRIDPMNGTVITYYSSPVVMIMDTSSSWADTIRTYSPNGKYERVRFYVRDTANSKTDSLVVEYYTVRGSWAKIGCTNLLTGATDLVIVPGDGSEGYWEAQLKYGIAYRIRRTNVSYSSGHVKTWVAVEAVTH